MNTIRSDHPETIRALATRLQRLESLLGTPAAYPNLEDEVVGVAHRLRNELTVFELSRHPNVLRARLHLVRSLACEERHGSPT